MGPPASPPRYTITDLGVLPGFDYAEGYGINRNGAVAGVVETASTVHAFLYERGAMRLLPLPGGQQGHAYGINDAGAVVGDFGLPDGSNRAFLYDGSTVRDLGTLPGGKYSSAYGVNNAGAVVGYSDGAGAASGHAFLYEGGVMHDLGTLPGEVYSLAYAIDDFGTAAGDSGGAYVKSAGGPLRPIGTLPGYSNSSAMGFNDTTIVGVCIDPGLGGQRAFAAVYFSPEDPAEGGHPHHHHHHHHGHAGPTALTSGYVLTDLGVLPGDDGSEATAINAQGVIVGNGRGAKQRAIVYVGGHRGMGFGGGTLYDLTTLVTGAPGWELSSARAINASGQIVGGGGLNGQGRAYLLTPA